jgi:cytosine/adenosine deaminase-related metal-dependent hydrolase
MQKPVRVAGFLILALALACTTAQAYRTVGAAAVAVDTGMKAWADYVVAGKATPDQEAKVRAAYTKVQDAARIAKVALQAGSDALAPADLSAAAAALLDLLAGLGVHVGQIPVTK